MHHARRQHSVDIELISAIAMEKLQKFAIARWSHNLARPESPEDLE